MATVVSIILSLLLLQIQAQAATEPSSCFEYGIDYTGYDILTLSGVRNPELCIESCAQSADCNFWSWDPESQTCYLKSSAAILGRTESPNIVSGPRDCLADDTCFTAGVDYVGFDVKRVESQNVASAKECQKLCTREPQCAFFSYKPSSKDCYLKNSGAVIGRTIDPEVISGPRVCPSNNNFDEGDLPIESCAEGSLEYRGHDVSISRNIRSAAYCQQLCATNSLCFYWTWDKQKTTCSQKDATAFESAQSGVHTLGKVSGPKDCVPINRGCQQLDTLFQGTVVRQMKDSASFETCQTNCQTEVRCAFWSWNSRTKLCLMKESTPFGYLSDTSTMGVISGPKYCPNDDVCLEQADYVGHDVETIEDGSVATATECRTLCRQWEGCEFWTWVQSTGNCYLKNSDALQGKTNGLSSIGRFSGPRDCFMQYGCVEMNTAYLGPETTKRRNVATFKECEERCQLESPCFSWTYLSTGRTCLLNFSSEATKIPMDGALAGKKGCKESQERGAHRCLYVGIKYDARPISTLDYIRSARSCHEKCAANDNCKTFTFEDEMGCYLYNQHASAMRRHPAHFPTVTSGPQICGGTTPIEGAVESGATGPIIPGASFYAYDQEECASRCTDIPTCVIWTFDPKMPIHTCTIRGGGSTMSNGSSIGTFSGEKYFYSSIYDGMKYDGTVLAVSKEFSAEACRMNCTAEMPLWTYYSDTLMCRHFGREAQFSRVNDARATCGTFESPTEWKTLLPSIITPTTKSYEQCAQSCSGDCRMWAWTNTLDPNNCIVVKGATPPLISNPNGQVTTFMF